MGQAVIFDIGGVLLDWDPRNLYRKMLPDETSIDAFFDEVGFANWNAQQDKGRQWSEGVADLSEQFPHRSSLIEAAHLRWNEMIENTFPDTVVILESLAAQQFPLYAITNFSSEKWGEVQKRFEFLSLFRDAVVSGDEKVMKPDAAIFQCLLTRNDLQAGECIFIDDSPVNTKGAEALGMKTVRFETSAQLRNELEEHGLII
ncbi:MAG: HAD family phosphatase [Sneathiella sp.]|uniref:HAD family hydrolase n=1 Tax=Sneathiella sp. TaxID=1964365 RepID=UPI003002D4C8